jgi:glycosyltransferase involved in cell wall biosynthesis
LRISAVTSFGPHVQVSGGRIRRERLFDALEEAGHHVDRWFIDARPGIPSESRAAVAALDPQFRHVMRQSDVVLLADLWTATAIPWLVKADLPTVVDVCDSVVKVDQVDWISHGRSRKNLVSLAARALRRHLTVQRLLPLATAVTYISEEDAAIDREEVARLPRTFVVPNGVADELLLAPLTLPPIEGEISWVANWRYEPNLEALRWYLAEVAPYLQGIGPLVRLYGPGLEGRAEDLAAHDVTYAGFAPHLNEVYEKARLVLAPVLHGAGVKNKVVEPLAVGRPVVTTPEGVSGLPADVRAQVTVSPPDGRAFAATISRALRARETASSADERRRSVQSMSWMSSAKACVSAMEWASESSG